MKRVAIGRRALLSVLLGTGAAHALPVIEPGNERRVLALFDPHRLGGEVTPGWRLWNVDIRPSEIDVELRGPGEQAARLRLVHDRAQAEKSASFGVVRHASSRSGEAARAADALVAALVRNDAGGFWTETGPGAAGPRGPGPGGSGQDQRARGLPLPFLVATISVAIMWLTSRRGRRPTTPPA